MKSQRQIVGKDSNLISCLKKESDLMNNYKRINELYGTTVFLLAR